MDSFQTGYQCLKIYSESLKFSKRAGSEVDVEISVTSNFILWIIQTCSGHFLQKENILKVQIQKDIEKLPPLTFRIIAKVHYMLNQISVQYSMSN
jgi:hypothetical protein